MYVGVSMPTLSEFETMTLTNEDEQDNAELLRLSADIVASYVSHNSASATSLPEIIKTVHQALSSLGETATPVAAPVERAKPAVPVSKSIQNDFIVCLEDGKKLKMLKRYLRAQYDLSPEEYRRKWGLPPDYPMVAPAYAVRRSEFAKQIGLGRGVRRQSGTAAADKAADRARGRKSAT
jgi:predicted transcriptional regulator